MIMRSPSWLRGMAITGLEKWSDQQMTIVDAGIKNTDGYIGFSWRNSPAQELLHSCHLLMVFHLDIERSHFLGQTHFCNIIRRFNE